MPIPFESPPETEQIVSNDNLRTYEQAAEYLHLSRGRIGGLVMEGVLHPIKLPNTRFKYLRQDEVEWYDRRRNGSAEPNPTIRSDTSQPAGSQDLGALLRQSDPHVAEVAALLVSGLLLMALVSVASPEQLKQMESAFLSHIRALREQPAGKELLANAASQIAGVLARGDYLLPDAQRERLSEFLDLLTTPSLQREASTKQEGALPSTR